MNISIHRIYDNDRPPGYHALVDRLWPRGISKDEANLDGHWKDLAPSNDLRKWFGHDPDKWADFRDKYLGELSQNEEEAKKHLDEVNEETLILLYGAKDKEHCHARILKEYLEKLI